MAEQRYQEQMPNFVGKPRTELIEIEQTASEILVSWAWPVSFWIIIILQTLIGLVVVKDMFTAYNPANHFFMTFISVLSLAVIAFIYKFILMRGK